MPAPKKFDDATRERAVRMYLDRLEQHGEAKVEARRQVGALLDINQATIRNSSSIGYLPPVECEHLHRQATTVTPIPEVA